MPQADNGGKTSVDPMPLRLEYVVGTYPNITTTFIDREIETLLEWGVDIGILAMRRPDPSLPLHSGQEALAASTTYLLPARWRDVIGSHMYFLARRPGVLLRTLVWLLTRPHDSMAARIKTLMHFGEGVLAAYLVRDRTFEEFHAHFADRAATVALIAGRLLDKPYSLSIHTGADIYVTPVILPEKLAGARAIVTCTAVNERHLRDVMNGHVGPPVRHVRHGLDVERYRPGNGHRADPPVLVAVGQLKPRKGFHHLIEACADLHMRGIDVRCEIIGDGPQREELEQLIDDRGLSESVQLLGVKSQEEVLDRYQAASLFVLPCIQTSSGDVDGIPNVVAEAMATGLPVVSSALPAIEELVISENNGILVTPGDTTALADAIERLLADASLRARLGGAGRATVLDGFDIGRNIRQFVSELWPGRVPERSGVE